MYVVNYTAMCRDMPGVGDVATTYQWFRMSYAGPRVLHYVLENIAKLLKEDGI